MITLPASVSPGVALVHRNLTSIPSVWVAPFGASAQNITRTDN